MDELRNAMVTIVDRMSTAGWVESSAITPAGVHVEWTGSGKEAIQTLLQFLEVLRFPLSAEEQTCLLYLVAKATGSQN